MSDTFENIVSRLEASDFDQIRSYVRDTVRGEWGDLIDSARRNYPDYSEGTGEPVEPEDAPEEAPRYEADEAENMEPQSFGEFLKSIGIGVKIDSRSHDDQHLRFHALQSALAWLSVDGNEGEPMVIANLFYEFLKGDA